MVTQGSDHVAEQDDDDDKDQEQVMGDVWKFIVIERTWRKPQKPSWLTIDIIVAYALPVAEEVILSIYREAEINSEFKMRKDIC